METYEVSVFTPDAWPPTPRRVRAETAHAAAESACGQKLSFYGGRGRILRALVRPASKPGRTAQFFALAS